MKLLLLTLVLLDVLGCIVGFQICFNNYDCVAGGSCPKDKRASGCTCTQCSCYDSCSTGQYCDNFMNTTACDNCAKTPCPTTNYTCTNGLNTRSCACAPTQTGNNCEFQISDPCASYPCMNGGTCSGDIGKGTFTCSCQQGYYGTQCQFSGDPCDGVTCVNGACTKIFDGSRAICNCTENYQGAKCDELIATRNQLGSGTCYDFAAALNSTAFTQYVNNAMTLEYCESLMMANTKYVVYVVAGDVCYVGTDNVLTSTSNDADCYTRCSGTWREKCGTIDYVWLYSFPYTEETAQCKEAPTPKCTSPTQGYCVEEEGTYECVCAPGYLGSTCSIVNNPCALMYCGAGVCKATLDNSTGYCVCPTGYTGEKCTVKDQCAFSPCKNGGTCATTGSNSYKCTCLGAFTGTNCESYLACASSPCVHGQCTDTAGSQYTCSCDPAWTGTNCDTDYDECSDGTVRCENGGTCINLSPWYECKCPIGWEGDECDFNPDDCNMTYVGPDGLDYPNLCNYYDPEAICVDGLANYTCICGPAWEDYYCDSDVDECVEAKANNESLCENFGTCVNTIGSYECTCITGTFGFNCSINPDDCLESNELIDGKYYPNKCIARDHQANCTDGFGTYTCTCGEYWEGQYCLDDVNECLKTPSICVNFATCENTPGFYKCHCIDGTEGQNCEINPDDCLNVTSCNSKDQKAVCTDGFAQWTCTCGPDYTGQYCDLEMIIYNVLQLIGGSLNEADLIAMLQDLLTNPSMMKDTIPFVIGLMSEANRTALSWDADDLFYWISYEEKRLDLNNDLKKWNDVVLGNCFTFNHFNETDRIYFSRQPGAQGGIKAAMKINTDEYVPWTETKAIMVFIHPGTETIFSESPRYNAEPGSMTTIQTVESRYKRLSGRYGDCVNSVAEVVKRGSSYYYQGSYTTDGCLRSCYQDQVQIACDCMDSRYPVPDNAAICQLSDRNCVNKVTDKGDVSKWAKCDCPLPCSNSQFDSQYTRAPFVHNKFKCATLSSVERANTTGCSDLDGIPDHLIVQIQVPRIMINIFEETPTWTFNKVVGNIGGLGGVVCGINLVTFCEFIFLLIFQLPITFLFNRQL